MNFSGTSESRKSNISQQLIDKINMLSPEMSFFLELNFVNFLLQFDLLNAFYIQKEIIYQVIQNL